MKDNASIALTLLTLSKEAIITLGRRVDVSAVTRTELSH